MPTESKKPFYKSRTWWGIILAALIEAVRFIWPDLPAYVSWEIGEQVLYLPWEQPLQAIFGLMALIGRLFAKDKIEGIGDTISRIFGKKSKESN